MGENLSPEAILAEAVRISDPEERAAYLDRVCGDGPEPRGEVESLLAAYCAAGTFMDPLVSLKPEAPGEKEGDRIGRYKLLELVGEGGFGRVWMAEQREPMERKVALKIVKLGMDTRQVVARFEAERQALAMMDHSNIATVFDGGATESGRPYFVMELVRGVPITDYCDANKLSPRDRIDLFRKVCEAVQHAHQKGIIHRDLKPSNILVTVQDDQPVPKVIDFGVAKALQKRLTERSFFTRMNQWVGTPAYMSPEQAGLGSHDVDTRSDVYSLGVILYELLTGRTPFGGHELRKEGYEAILRKIREEDPPKPSTRLSALTRKEMTDIADHRGQSPEKLGHVIHGELDWIVMMALEKDRTRRYETANALARDVERYLNYEPVEAGPPSAIYRLRKYARRHRGTLAAAAAVLITLVTGVVASNRQAERATREAERAMRETERAMREAKKATAVSEFLVHAFRSPDPERDGRTVTVVEVLDQAAEALEGRFKEEPLTRAALLATLGRTFESLGQYDAAEPLLEELRLIVEEQLGETHRETLSAMNNLAVVYRHQGRYEQAEELHLETLEARKKALGKTHLDTVDSMNNLGSLYFDRGRHEKAEELFRETLQVWKTKLGESHPDTLMALNNLANVYVKQKLYKEAEELYLETLNALKMESGEYQLNALNAMSNLGVLYFDWGRHKEAERLFRETLKVQKVVLGENHPDTLTTMDSLASVYLKQGLNREAEDLYLETLEALKKKLGETHPDTLNTMNNLGGVYADQGRDEDAEALMLETLEAKKSVLGENHPDTLMTMNNLALVYRRQGRLEEAAELYRGILESQKTELGEIHPQTLGTMNDLGASLMQADRTAEAIPILLEALDGHVRALGPAHPDTLRSRVNLAIAHHLAGQTDEAGPLEACRILTSPGNGIDTPISVIAPKLEHVLSDYSIRLPRIEPSEEAVKKYFSRHRESFAETSTRIGMIRIPKAEHDKKFVEGLRERLLEGADFGELAKAYSDDDYSSKGGDRGWLKQGHFRTDIDTVAFNLNAGEISKILVDETYYWIVKVAGKREDEVPPFEEIRDRIVKRMQREHRDEILAGWIEKARTRLKADFKAREEYLKKQARADR